MRFTVAVAPSRLDRLTELAKTAQASGYSAIALPDSIFYSEKVSEGCPYTPDGSRFRTEEMPWADPLAATAAMGAVTDEIRFYNL